MTEYLQAISNESFGDSEFTELSHFSHLGAEMDEGLNDLLRALRRKKGFGLFFVQCNPPQGKRVIAAIRERFPKKRLMEIELNQESEALYEDLLERYQADAFEIACITGVEQAMYRYEDTKRLAGWTPEEIYNYSWKGLPPLLSHLNRQREAFEDNLPAAFVFLVPSFVIDYFVQRAPDFFDWRSGFFKLLESSDEFEQLLQEFADQDYEDYLSLSEKERFEKILQIKDKIMQLKVHDNKQKSQLLREQGRLFVSGSELKRALDCFDRALLEGV